MGLAELVHVDARDVADELGLGVVEVHGAEWLVGSSRDTILVQRGASEAVTQDRIWEGISQCLLGRLGVEWTATQARDLSGWLRSATASSR